MNSRIIKWGQFFDPTIIMLLILTIIAEAAVQWGWISPFLFASPSQVLSVMSFESHTFVAAFIETGKGAGAGLLISFLLGVGVAFLLCLHPFFERAFLPISLFFQTVPIIAVSPLLVIWFGFGLPTVIAAATIASFFPVLANVLTGLTRLPASRLELFRLYGATPLQLLFKLRVPQALPSLFTGLEIAAGLSVIGAIVGEFIAGGGLGSLIDSARTQQRIDIVFAAVLLSSLLGLCFVLVVRFSRFVVFMRWPADGKIAE